MKRFLPTFIVLAAALLGFAPGQAAEPDPAALTVAVPGGDSLAIRVPKGWKCDAGKPAPEAPPTVDFTSPGGIQAKLTMMADAEGRFVTPEAVDELVTIANQHFAENAIEKTPKLIRIKAKVGHGAYCIFTDSKLVGVSTPAEGEIRNVTSGVFVIGKQAVIFTILSNDITSDEYRAALDLISNGISVAAPGG